ncbi:Protein inscuteable homologue C-terminal domain-containing protein [Caenorhabditis elegans]|nr:Protein inscuteable homologue C-terminal domain-containing protein [Caenorhabditis elegans]CCD63542.1 Protein inscuteable homologue C-terminal domain-containing protein [Caenorhabditis elegans]|eukprot:NP_495539.3 INSCuteable (Drososphila asymmetric cell division protein) homolog [Caenorhabditis elegans]
MLSTSLGNISAPPKPQRRIARLRSGANDCAASLPQLLERNSIAEMMNNSLSDKYNSSSTTLCSSVHAESCPTDTEDAIIRNIKLPGFRGNISRALSQKSNSPSGCRTPTPKTAPPSYEQFQVLRRNSMKSSVQPQRNGILSPAPPVPTSSRANTITVNGAHVQQAMNRIDMSTDSANTILRSPYSTRSDSITSVDSGQCSGDQIERRSNCSTRQESKDDDDTGMPSYARMASTMDHVLRTSSALYTLLSSALDPATCRDLLAKSSVFIQLLESSPCTNYLPKTEMARLKMNVQELQKNRDKGIIDMNNMTNFFAILLRKSIESVLLVFVRIISKNLCESNGKDRLTPICLEHLIHICLFGDELCIEAIQKGCISSVIRIMKNDQPQENTLRFLLRTLAVLCGVSKGALALLTQGGLDLVIDRLLSISSSICSVEAAGILTQLTNPQSAFIRLNHVEPIISRLLDLIDQCKSGDSLLLATAALNNVTLQNPNGVDIMYRNNSIRRLISAYNRENCATVFVQEQIVTAFSRLAARHLDHQMVDQNAIPVLLEFLSLTHPIHADYCRRIRYKAAVCIGTLANSEIGLKALYGNNAYAILSNVLYDDNNSSNPFNMICNNIRTKLESKYQSESAV